MNNTPNRHSNGTTNNLTHQTNIRHFLTSEYINQFSSQTIPTNPDLRKNFYFSNKSSLTELEITSHITIATHNVNGLNSIPKQKLLMQSLNDKCISICELTDTRLTSTVSKHTYKYEDYHPYWNPMSSSGFSGGVGLLIKKELTTYIQSVKCWKDRILYIDIYLEGRIKLRILITYIPPTSLQNKAL